MLTSHLQEPTKNPLSTTSITQPEPHLEWKYQFNEKSDRMECYSVQLSDGSPPNKANIDKALEKASGASDPKVGERILQKIARSLSPEELEHRMNEASALLPALEPKDPTEALLLGQFLALNDSGMRCLRLANDRDQAFYHTEKLFTLAHKLFITANQTMQTVLKYRSGGQQTVQVIHVHNEGQAIVAQHLSAPPREERGNENS